MAKDFSGKELCVGDKVVFTQVGYRGLVKGTIEKITPKKVLVSHAKLNIGGTTTMQLHEQVVKL